MKHKHAECIKAWADGAQIERLGIDGYWADDPIPYWYVERQYRVKDPYAELKAAAADPTKQIRCGCYGAWRSSGHKWGFDAPADSYEIRDKPDPYAELKAAAADPNKEIRVRDHADHEWQPGKNWLTNGGEYKFGYQPEAYEIRDKPKAKPKAKVKMWQWVCRRQEGEVYLTQYFYPDCPDVRKSTPMFRAPWTEIEVDAP